MYVYNCQYYVFHLQHKSQEINISVGVTKDRQKYIYNQITHGANLYKSFLAHLIKKTSIRKC